jgi:hypothetical protein
MIVTNGLLNSSGVAAVASHTTGAGFPCLCHDAEGVQLFVRQVGTENGRVPMYVLGRDMMMLACSGPCLLKLFLAISAVLQINNIYMWFHLLAKKIFYIFVKNGTQAH